MAGRFRNLGNVYILGTVSLLTDLSSQMVFPLIPLFMTSVLGAGAAMVGLVEGAAEAVASILKAFSGRWSDRARQRKPFVVGGYGFSALMKPLFSIAGSWASVLAIRTGERIGKGIRNAPRDALVAESVDDRIRGRAFGIQRAMDGAGSILGALAAWLLLSPLGYRKVFLYAGIPAGAAVLVALFVKERRAGRVRDGENGEKPRIGFSALPPGLRLYILSAAVFTLGHFGYPFMLLRARDVGLTDTRAVLFYVIFYGVYTLVSVPAGTLSDRTGRKPMLLVCYPFFGAISLLLWAAGSGWAILACFMLYGVFFGMIDGVQRAFVTDLCPPELKATALGTFHAAIGLSALPGGIIAGLLWQRFSPGATFAWGAAMSAAGLALLLPVDNGRERTT